MNYMGLEVVKRTSKAMPVILMQYKTMNMLLSVFFCYLLFCVSVSLLFALAFSPSFIYSLSVPLHSCSPMMSLCLGFDLSHVHTRVNVMPLFGFWVSEFFLPISFAQFPAWLLICILIKKNTVCNFM